MVTPDVEEAKATGVTTWVLLLVDDESRRRSLRREWEDAGFGVEIASNAREALACLKVMTPTAVVIEDRVYRPLPRRSVA